MSSTIAASFLPEFDHEMSVTRRCLERVPDDRLDFQPHEKSMKLGRLASHLAESPMWAGAILGSEEFDIEPPDGSASFEQADLDSREAILALFDKSVADCRRMMAETSDEDYAVIWTFKKRGEVVVQMPRAAVIRAFVLNHNVHHRAQLGVYLRLCDVAVPAVYGPSADDEGY